MLNQLKITANCEGTAANLLKYAVSELSAIKLTIKKENLDVVPLLQFGVGIVVMVRI